MTRTPGEESRQEEAFARLKARYAEARRLASSGEPYANLDWILGVNRDPDERSEDVNRKMIPLVSLWLEDLAVELERGLAGMPPERMADSAAAHRACQSAAMSLRKAALEFVATLRRAG